MLKRSLLVLLMAGAALAEPTPKKVAMVLKAEGKTQVLTGQLWAAGDHISLPAGSKVTVLMLNKGERIELSGEGTVEVSGSGLKVEGAQSKKLASTQMRLAMTGENQRQIGGMTLRTPGAAPEANSVLDGVEVSESGVRLSRPAAKGAPPRLQFFYLEHENMPLLSSDFGALARVESPAQSVFSTQVAGRRVGSRWVYEAPWPLEDGPKNYSLRVFPVSSGAMQLWTRLYRPGPDETKELATAREQVRQWVAREPRNAEPWVYLANLLEEKGRLQEASQALESALALRPQDPGLLEMKMRLLLDLGRYLQAYRLKNAPARPTTSNSRR